MSRIKSLLLILVVAVLAFAAAPSFAHEGREVGDYILTFGWRVEPALAGYPNGPEVFIEPHHHEAEAEHADGDDHAEDEHAEDPMASIPVSLQVEVTFGPAAKTLPLELAWGTTNHYIADLIPTRAGDYTFRVFGTIGDVEVDETFSSADGEFSSVEPAGDVTFPDALPSTVELLDMIAALEARLAALEGS